MRRSVWPWILLLLAAAAVGAYVHFWPDAPLLATDSPSYMVLARDIANGAVEAPGVRTPGYPLLLAATGAAQAPTRALFLVQLLLQVASVFLMCSTLRAVGASSGLTLAAGVVGLLPSYFQSAAYVLTESLTQFCLVLAIACLQRYLDRGGTAWLLGASAALGYAALTRPSFLLAAIALAGALFLLRRGAPRPFGLQAAAGLLAGTVVLVGGYAIYCQSRFGVSGTTSTLGSNLANRCPDLYEAIPDPTTRRLLVAARNEAYAAGRSVAWAHFTVQDRLIEELGISKAEVDPWFRHQFSRAILAHPVEYAEIVAASFARFWFPATGSLPLLNERPLRLVWYGVHFAVVGTLLVEAAFLGGWIFALAAGLPADNRTRAAWTLWVSCAAVVLYNAVISCMLETGETRYRTSTELVLVLAAAAGVIGVRGLFHTLQATARKLATRPGSA